MLSLKYLVGYPEAVQAQVRELIQQGRLADRLRQRYPGTHAVRTDRLLYDYTVELKNRHLRNAAPLSKVVFDNHLQILQHALGTHTSIARVQGNRLKAKREIRVASLFKTTPPEFLKMIVVHELAHLREAAHNKAFYQLCGHMEPGYHQLEFDLRLYLTQQDLDATIPG